MDNDDKDKVEPYLFPLVSLHDGDYQENLYPDGKWWFGWDNWKERVTKWLRKETKQGDCK